MVSTSQRVITDTSRRAQRALARQLLYQRRKATKLRGHEAEVIQAMQLASQRVRRKLEQFRTFTSETRVAEIGSGAHGLIFFFGSTLGVGVDPLVVEYSKLFPKWQRRVATVAAVGETLPFPDKSFDVVLCDNVVDHAKSPKTIVAELGRILKPAGLLYFTVNVHHPIYSVVSELHSYWNRLGIKYEIRPFADHTVHLTLQQARDLFQAVPIRILLEHAYISEAKARAARTQARHMGDIMKRLFFKNAVYELIATRC
ncbi:MAG TPA: methyltransferase domain-containing protein [Pyrinomonadaceae bacterium]|nr:methyltransferase domain-containing protein [Pyrinomonadaceae bacterium]